MLTLLLPIALSYLKQDWKKRMTALVCVGIVTEGCMAGIMPVLEPLVK